MKKRLRKKTHRGEFRELGFVLTAEYEEKPDMESLCNFADQLMDKFEELGMDVSGASHVDMEALKAGYCDVECSGASKLSVWCEKEIALDCSGASKINVYGPGTITRQDVSGASAISKK